MRMFSSLKSTVNKSIAKRWFVNSISIIFVILIIFVACMSFVIQNYIYNGIQQVLLGRSDELLIVFESSKTSDFQTVARSYIEDFPDKNEMEIMLISKYGSVLATSTGFEPDSSQVMPDYTSAVESDTNFGYWIGNLDTGEKVMAITRVVRNSWGGIDGSLRYIVSMTKADEQIVIIVTVLIIIGGVVAMFIVLSGIYFIRSIIVPVSQITKTARKISDGDFEARLKKDNDDEIGKLIDTINEMAEELGNSEKMKNDFISSVSHELRTPLTAIKGWAETLQEGGLDKNTSKKGMRVIIKESQRLSGIVEELLDFSRIQNGRLKLNFQKGDVLSELDEAVFLFTERAKIEGKTIIYDEETVLPQTTIDPNRIKQVFVNVIDNALKYTASGGIIIISGFVEDNKIHVKVEDNGCGIESEHLPHITKKFYKANQLVRGSGIGLAVVNEIITMHKGKLEISSEVGVGTTVKIELPII